MLHVSILLSVSGSTLRHCSQPGNKKWDPIPARTGCLLFLGTSSWLYGHGITFSSWHVFEAVFSCALSALQMFRLGLQAEKWDLGSWDHPWEHSARACVMGAALVWWPLWVSLSPAREWSGSGCNTPLCQVYSCSADCEERLFPQQNSPAQWVYSSLHLGR